MSSPSQDQVIFATVELSMIAVNLGIGATLLIYVLVKRRRVNTSTLFVVQLSLTAFDQILNALMVVARTWIIVDGEYNMWIQLTQNIRDFIFQLSQWVFVYQFLKVTLLMPLVFISYKSSSWSANSLSD